MSSNDGIYIAKVPTTDNQGSIYCVAYASAIDNAFSGTIEMQDEYRSKVFSNTTCFEMEHMARSFASVWEQTIETEYGVVEIEFNRPLQYKETTP
jgi:hypothetical protein